MIDRDEVEDMIIKLMAAEQDVRPEDLRDLLACSAPTLPVDSVLAVEVLVAVEERFGVRLPDDAATAEHLRSVRMFAEAVVAATRDTVTEKRAG